MLTVRFARVGKNKRAQFKIVLQEHTIAPGGRHVEILGSYDPHLKKSVLKEDRIKYWISQGVQFSDSVYNLMVSKGLISGDKRKVKLPEKKKEEKVEEAGAEAPKAEEAKEESSKEGEEKPAAQGATEAKEEVKEEKKEEAPKEEKPAEELKKEEAK